MAKLNIDANEALAEIKALTANLKDVRKEINAIKNSSPGSYDDMQESMNKLKETAAILSTKIRFLRKEVDKQQASAVKETKATKENTKATVKNSKSKKQNTQARSKDTKATKQNTTSKKKNTDQTKKQQKANQNLTGSLKSLFRGFGLFIGLNFLGQILTQTYEQIKTFDSLRFTLKLLNGTVQEYNSASRFMLTLARDFGVELISTTNRWVKFSAAANNAGLALRETETIFRSLTKAGAALGLNTDELSGIYLALEQMLSKGKVTTEELRRQLGERLPGAMGIMASALDVTIPKLDEMLRKGEVLSAEALPKFAEAVEVAYGIQAVEKVDNLVSAQNRLVTAWQNFVKTVSDDDSIIQKVLSGFMNKMTQITRMFNELVGGEKVAVQKQIISKTKSFQEQLERRSINRLKQRIGFEERNLYLRQEIADLEDELNKEGNLERREELDTQIQKRTKELIKFNRDIKETEREIAKELFPESVDNYNEAKEAYQRALNAYEDKVSERDERRFTMTEPELDQLLKETSQAKELLSVKRDALTTAESRYDVLRKLIGESKVEVDVAEEEEKKTKKKTLRLKELLTLEKQRKIASLETNIELNNGMLKSDKVGFEERIELIKDNNEKKNEIARLQFQIEKDQAVKAEKEKIAAIERAQKEGDIIEGADPEKRKSKLSGNRQDAVAIANQKALSTIVKNNVKAQESILNVVDEANDQYVKGVKNKYNLEIIAANEAYENTKKTEKDKKHLSKQLEKIGVEAANAQIDAQIELRKSIINSVDLSEDALAKLILEINELRASKQKFFDQSKKEGASEYEFWMGLTNFARDYAAAAGDIVNNLHARKIENIEAEIRAEEEKYDKLIQLAKGDEEQQKALRENKAQDIRRLEKKKLKEKQKQAKAEKAFTIADIAMSTAQAIMGIWAQVPKFDFGVSAGVLTAMVSALGAAQMAAVASQPIPKFKDGGTSNKDQIAMINDGGQKEYIKRGDNILTTDTKDAITNLKKDDVIYKNYDDMINNELLGPNNINPVGLNENNFDQLFFGIKSSITEGFKKAKIKNIIKVVNDDDNENYKEKLSRW